MGAINVRQRRFALWALTAVLLAVSALLSGGPDGVLFGVVHAQESSDQQYADVYAILDAVDAQLNFDDVDFAAVMTFLVQDPEKGIDKFVVRQFRRDAENKFLLLFQEPIQQRGQGYLQDGDNLWFYDPESRKFSHTSLKEQFEGSDARNDDFSQSTIADDYRVVGHERGTLGRYAVHVVDLEARHNEVPDPFIKMWITQDTYLVLKIESYSLNKRLVRTALYPSYQRAGDKIFPKQMIFVDELIPDKKTQITVDEISFASLDDSVFTKAFVERVNR